MSGKRTPSTSWANHAIKMPWKQSAEAVHADSVQKTMTASVILVDDNPYDDHAVRVDIRGHTIGHLSRQC